MVLMWCGAYGNLYGWVKPLAVLYLHTCFNNALLLLYLHYSLTVSNISCHKMYLKHLHPKLQPCELKLVLYKNVIALCNTQLVKLFLWICSKWCVRVHLHCMELGLESFILMGKVLFSVSPDASASWKNEWDLTIPQQELLELPG